MSKFAEVVVKKIKGDEAEVLAGKIERKAKSAFTSQIAALQSKKVELEDKKDTALAALEAAIYPDTQIFDSESYVRGVRTAQTGLDAAVDNIAAVDESIEFYEELVKAKF